MNEKTEQRIIGWGQFIFGALAVIVVGLSALIKWLESPLIVPLWVFLAVVFLLIALFFVLSRQHRNELARLAAKHDAECEDRDQLADRLRELQEQTDAARAVAFTDGAYFRTSDTQHQQPFCRVCYDANHDLITVSEDFDYCDNEWIPTYACPACGRAHNRRVVLTEPPATEPELDDGYIPF